MSTDREEGTGRRLEGDGERSGAAEPRIRRRGRRVTTEPTPGYIGEPDAEQREESDENDERLRQDKPPHWG
ncbi:MAG TPA: hypothetical protein H9830_14170 [Candidatus Agrococcus pullicola]|uniref:Uncharacterized protein n=1 Tax=Candidatus Agrococcus pullicola TaxID=2838429 RepID=A0A9D1YX10_9MICO|nr:hypothetical protein [Candidatus Agrococcus pullicola]